MRMKKVAKRILGGAISVALTMAMAVGIFAGTGMEVRAADGLTFESASICYSFDSTDVEYIIYNLVKDKEWLSVEDLELYTEWIANNLGIGIYIISAKTGSTSGSYLFQYIDALTSPCSFTDVSHLYENTNMFHNKVYVLTGGSISTGSSDSVSNDASSSSGASYAPHTHSYSWVTVQDASVGQDGNEEYRCSCGDVQERCVIPASAVAVSGLYGAVKDAPQNGTASFDSGRLYTLSDYVIKKLAERTDVTTVITFEYQNQAYKMTIPAGVDYTPLLSDGDYFYGYFYFANAVGATIEAVGV